MVAAALEADAHPEMLAASNAWRRAGTPVEQRLHTLKCGPPQQAGKPVEPVEAGKPVEHKLHSKHEQMHGHACLVHALWVCGCVRECVCMRAHGRSQLESDSLLLLA